MKQRSSQGGFTIIETLLFLAVSTGMIVGAMAVVSGRTQQVQFTDSIRSIESFIERRISNVSSGSVIGDSQECSKNAGGYSFNSSDGSCIFLGYMFWFGEDTALSGEPDPSQIGVYQLFGERLTSSEVSDCASSSWATEISCVQPTTSPASPVTAVEMFDIPWGVELTDMFNEYAGSNIQSRMVGFLRDPAGTSLIPVAFQDIPESLFVNLWFSYLPYNRTPISWYDSEVSTKSCFSDGERKASISISTDARQSTVDAEFNDPDCSV